MLLDSLFCNIVFETLYDKKLLQLRKQCYIAEKVEKNNFRSRQENSTSCNFLPLQHIARNLLIVKLSSNFILKTLLQIQSYQMLP